jgi:hypothetical protein
MKLPSVPTLVWFLAFVAVSIILLQTQKVPSYEASGIIFDTKSFNDTGPTDFGDDVVSIAGTLTGDGVANKNNTVSITCYQDRMECLIYSIAQIGPKSGWQTRHAEHFSNNKLEQRQDCCRGKRRHRGLSQSNNQHPEENEDSTLG